MNQVATQERPGRKLTPVEHYADQVMGDEARRDELLRALPNHIPPARFQRNLFNLLMQKPEILQYDPRLVYREVSKAAALGLSLDPQFAEADIVPVWNAKAGRKEPELRPRYKGLMKLARQSGEVADIYPGEVREADHWFEEQGTERRLEHTIDRRSSRGNAFCYYAVVIYKDGTKDFEVMDMDEIHAIREKSDSWQAYQAKKIKTTPWATDKSEMCKKTVLKRLLKRVPQSSDLAEALALDHDRGALETIEHAPLARPSRPAASISARLDNFANGEEAEAENEAQANETSAPATAALPQDADQPEELPANAPPSSGETASSEAEEGTSPDDADLSKMAPKLKAAREKGAAARRSNYAREVPKALKGDAHKDEAETFLRGWDDEDNEIRTAEQFGD